MEANNCDEDEDEEYAFREQFEEAMAASLPHQPDEELLVAIKFQKILEQQFSASQTKTDDITFDQSPLSLANLNNNDDNIDGVIEEYRKLNITMEELKLRFNGGEEREEWDDAVEEFEDANNEEEEFNEAMRCTTGGFYSLYFKGVSMSEGESKEGRSTSAMGVIIRRPHGGEVAFQLQKRLGYYVEESVAEHLALIEGLLIALDRGFSHVNAFTDSKLSYDQIARLKVMSSQVSNLELLYAVRHRVLEHARKLDCFTLTLNNVESVDAKTAIRMAREAIHLRSFVGLHNMKEYADDHDDEEEGGNGVLYVGIGHEAEKLWQRQLKCPCFLGRDLSIQPTISTHTATWDA